MMVEVVEVQSLRVEGEHKSKMEVVVEHLKMEEEVVELHLRMEEVVAAQKKKARSHCSRS
jgi:hypothetical protein